MSVTAIAQEWMRSIGPREESAVVARSHVQAEMQQDADAICATISRDSFFVLPTRTASGYRLDDGDVLTAYDNVHSYYTARMRDFVVEASRQLKTVASHWYVFNESIATLTTGTTRAGDAPGKRYSVQAAVLFPTAPDGIKGEIAVGRHTAIDGASSGGVRTEDLRLPPDLGDVGSVPLEDLAQADALDRFVLAHRAGDTVAVSGALTPQHCLAVRLDLVGGGHRVHVADDVGGSASAFHDLFAGAYDVALMARISTPWYSFAEYLLELGDGVARRLALIHGIQDGRFAGTFGFGREERAAASA
jgi:hypothetical protein